MVHFGRSIEQDCQLSSSQYMYLIHNADNRFNIYIEIFFMPSSYDATLEHIDFITRHHDWAIMCTRWATSCEITGIHSWYNWSVAILHCRGFVWVTGVVAWWEILIHICRDLASWIESIKTADESHNKEKNFWASGYLIWIDLADNPYHLWRLIVLFVCY